MKKTRKIGNSNLGTYPFVLGGNVFGWTANEKASFEILDTYVDAGFNFIDTADIYSVWVKGHNGGESEAIIGNWLKKNGKGDNVMISTKVGGEMSDSKKGLKKEYIIKAVEDSLKRLNTDYIDLYFTHYDDLSTPIEETLEAYASLIAAGKIRYIGASNMSSARIRESLEVSKVNSLPAYICLQPQYNLYEREGYEKDYEPLAEKYDLGVICYYSLASGFLTGKYKSVADLKDSQRGGDIEKYLNDRGMRIINELQSIADQYNATCAQIALAWLQATPSITAPIASASNNVQLSDILKSIDIDLDEKARRRLDTASSYKMIQI